MAISKIIGASVADDAIDVSDLGTIMSVGETAPSSPFIGQRWYRASTAITYQYTSDGTSSFWLDVSSGGIGTSASRGVDFVGDTDPHLETNGSSLAVGSVYYNREANRYFVCTNNTTDANVWSGRYAGLGGTETTVKIGSNFYRVHCFWDSGTFYMDDSINVDYVVVAGGGGGGAGNTGSSVAGSGGGAGGFRTGTGLAVTPQSYSITIGAGAVGMAAGGSTPALSGSNSVFSSITATGGGGGATRMGSPITGRDGGSGGGGTYENGAGGSGVYNSGQTLGHVLHQGRNGGTASNQHGGTGGGGAAAVGANGTNNDGAVGGAGTNIIMGLSNANSTTLLSAVNAGVVSGSYRYLAGGGGGSDGNGGSGAGGAGGVGGGGNGAVAFGTRAQDGHRGTGGGGGGGPNGAWGAGGDGGSGIVIIRYQLNA